MPKNNVPAISDGAVFNRLTVIRLSHQDKKWRRFYLCRCECGEEKIIHGASMVSGNTKSCGCLKRDRYTKRAEEVQKTKAGAKTAIYLGYKRHARDRGYSFEITKDELIELSSMKCFYCGAGPSNIKTTKNDVIGLKYNGIDRVDNSKGYSINNCVPCCKICNVAKATLTIVKFKAWVEAVSSRAEQWGDPKQGSML